MNGVLDGTTARVLVVSADDAFTTSSDRHLGSRDEFEVVTAGTVAEAMQYLRTQDDIECVISDHDTPDIDAIAFLETVRSQHPLLPFIMFTGKGSEQVASRAIHAGVTDYLIKESHERWESLSALIHHAVGYYRAHSDGTPIAGRQRAFLDAMPDMVLVLDEDTVQYVNQAGLTLLGLDDPADLVGTSLLDRLKDYDGRTRDTLYAIHRGDYYIDALDEAIRDENDVEIPVEITVAQITWQDAPANLAILSDRSHLTAIKERLRQTARINTVIREINHLVITATTADEILTRTCDRFVESGRYRMAWIGEYDADSGRVTPQAWAGFEDGYLDEIDIQIGDTPTGQGPTGRAIATLEPQISQDIAADPAFAPWRQEALDRGYESSAALPLLYEDTLYGVLNLYATEPDAFDPVERDLLELLAGDIAFAVHSLREHEELAELYRLHEATLSNIRDTVLITDDDGAFTYVCPNSYFIFGLTDEEVENKGTIVALFGVEPLDREQIPADGEVSNVETTVTDTEGETHTVLVSASQVDIGDGTVLYTVHDITERKAQEVALGQNRERLALALAAANAGVWDYAIDTGEVIWDASVERLFGLKPGTFEGTYEAFADRIHPEDLPAVEADIEHALESTGSFSSEFRIQREDGVERWVLAQGILTEEVDGSPRLLGVDIDITERKEREQHMLVIDRVLRHNLRNDLNFIGGMADTIAEQTSGQVAEFAVQAADRSEKLLATAEKERLIIETLTSPPSTEPVDLPAVVTETVESLQERYPDADIEMKTPDRLQALVVQRFDRVIEELVENAVLHNDNDQPMVAVSVEADDGTVTATVADNGPPIPEMNVGVLTWASEEPLYHGSGLGLWLVHWLVRRADGRLEFAANEPRGNVITITLPAAGRTLSESHQAG